MTLVFKKNGGNKPHSLVPQKRSCSCVTSSNEGRMFPSHRHHQVGSIENPKEFHRRSAVSSVEMRLPPVTEIEEAFSEGLRRSLRIREKTLHLYEGKMKLCTSITDRVAAKGVLEGTQPPPKTF